MIFEVSKLNNFLLGKRMFEHINDKNVGFLFQVSIRHRRQVLNLILVLVAFRLSHKYVYPVLPDSCITSPTHP